MVNALIRRARARLMVDEALRQTAFAAAVTVLGLVIVLILGTRYLEWWTLALFALVGIGIGIARVLRRRPTAYATAVRMDRNAGLHDALATAFYFSGDTSEFAGVQRRQAEIAAGAVHVEAAVPFTFPKELYGLAALALVASGLFAVRFYSMHRMDLRAPLTEVLFEDAALRKNVKQNAPGREAMQRQRLETAESLMAKLGVPLNPEDRKQPDALDKALDQAFENPGSPAGKGEKGQGEKVGGTAQQPATGDPLDGQQAANADRNSGKTPEQKDGSAGDKGNAKSGSGDNQSLLSKLKDAVSNMLSKNSPGEAGAGQKGQQQQAAQGAKAEKGAGEKSNGGKGQEQGQNQADAQEGDPNGDAQQGQQAQGKAGAKSSQQSSQAGNGVGSQDGAKDLRAAEQLKAMGKISEIIGKRAATVTGETTIEVQSGNQQLRTAYSDKKAAHGEADSDVSRDEIPVELQSYVQSYFEQVRKPAASAKMKATP